MFDNLNISRGSLVSTNKGASSLCLDLLFCSVSFKFNYTTEFAIQIILISSDKSGCIKIMQQVELSLIHI